MVTKRDVVAEGAASYEAWKAELRAKPGYEALQREVAAQLDLWLQLVDARQEAGLTQQQMAERMGISQAQVARIEKRGYEAYTLNTLRRYVKALGDTYELVVAVRRRGEPEAGGSLVHAG